MSAPTAAPPATPLLPSAGHMEDLREKHAHAGVAMAIATLAMGAASGIQALLYLSSFGVGGRTDGFFVAFALYSSFGVFSQSIRVTSAPMLVGSAATALTRRVRLRPGRDRDPGGDRDDPPGRARWPGCWRRASATPGAKSPRRRCRSSAWR